MAKFPWEAKQPMCSQVTPTFYDDLILLNAASQFSINHQCSILQDFMWLTCLTYYFIFIQLRLSKSSTRTRLVSRNDSKPLALTEDEASEGDRAFCGRFNLPEGEHPLKASGTCTEVLYILRSILLFKRIKFPIGIAG